VGLVAVLLWRAIGDDIVVAVKMMMVGVNGVNICIKYSNFFFGN